MKRTDLPAGMIEWLRRTERIEIHNGDFASRFTFRDYPWQVWLTNGESGSDWTGTLVARTETELDAKLVAAGLQALKDDDRSETHPSEETTRD